MALQDELKAVRDQVVKATGEVTGKVEALEARIASLEATVQGNAEALAELEAAKAELADLKSSVQSLDELNPDAPVEPPVEEPPVEEPPVEETPGV
jgi:chaperonin cofactor prefoldin